MTDHANQLFGDLTCAEGREKPLRTLAQGRADTLTCLLSLALPLCCHCED